MKPKKQDEVIALFCSDLHLSLTPPIFRSNEPDWLAAQQRPLDELTALQEKHDCPIFCAGDIFDKWNSPAELINFAMGHLPYMHCIPGQHDLPEHDLGQIERSAYWTLVKASIIHDMSETVVYHEEGLMIYPFCYGKKITLFKGNKKIKPIAIIHEYNWVPGHVYQEEVAAKSQHVDSGRREFEGYDIVVSGDNHSAFSVLLGKTQFVNCGTFMQRKSDEWTYAPSVWMLLADGQMVQHPLMTSYDKHLDITKAERLERDNEDIDLSSLIDGLGKLGKCTLDFADAVKHHLAKYPVDKRVERRIFKAMESDERSR